MNPSPSEGSLWLVARTLWYREMIRFMRQRSRIIGAVATPLIFWIVIGSGLGSTILSGLTIRRTLAFVLLTATVKLFFSFA